MKAIINAYFHERIGYRELIRALIAHKQWFLPAQKHEHELHPSLFQHGEETILTAYSNEELVPKEIEKICVAGTWLFAEFPAVLDAFLIDPQSDHALKFTKDKFSNLSQWAKAVHIEQLLAQSEFDANVLEQLLSYSGYCIPVVQSSDGKQHIALAPDTEGRKLAAIFTAEDALSTFMQHAGNALGDHVLIDQPPGTSLFPYLVSLPIDGIVFNCYGPPAPYALNKASLERLLAERNPT